MPITKLLDGLPNQSMPQAVFDAATGQFMTDLPAWGAEATALAVDVNLKQIAAAASELAAAGSATVAQTAAANSVAAADLVSTSATSRTIGPGDVTFAIAINKRFRPGMPIVSAMTDFPGNKFIGYVKSYDPATGVLIMAVEATQGNGTAIAWSISISGPYITPFVAGGATVAGQNLGADRILTNASGRLQSASFKTGFGFQMPNATTLNTGPSQFALANAADYTTAAAAMIKDAAGVLRGFLSNGCTTDAHLLESTTPGGKWIFPEASPVGVAAAAVLNASSAVGGVNGTFIKAFPLDADRTMLLIHGVSLHAVIYNQTLNTWGAITLLRTAFATAGAVDNVMAVPTNTPGQLLVFSVGEGQTNGVAMVVWGGSAGNTVSPGAATTVTLGGACSRLVDFIKSGSSYILGFMVGTTTIRFRAFTTVSDTPATGVETALTTVAPPALLASDVGGFGVMTSTATVLQVTGYSVSGTTNTLSNAVTSSVSSAANITLKQTGTGRYLIAYVFSGTAQTITLAFSAGSVPSFSTNTTLISSAAMTAIATIQTYRDGATMHTAVTGADASGRFMTDFACVYHNSSGDPVTMASLVSRYFSAVAAVAPMGIDAVSSIQGTLMVWQVSTAKEISFHAFLVIGSANYVAFGKVRMGAAANLTLARSVPAIYPKSSLAMGTLHLPNSGVAAAVGDGSKPPLAMLSTQNAMMLDVNLNLPADSANGAFGSDTSMLWIAYGQGDTSVDISQVRLAA